MGSEMCIRDRIDREKEASLQKIANEKLHEHEKREIAEVIRSRVEVDKTVAQREEEINELRVVSEADRKKKAQVIMAEAEAEEALVKDIKAAEAAEKSADFIAKEKAVIAQAVEGEGSAMRNDGAAIGKGAHAQLRPLQVRQDGDGAVEFLLQRTDVGDGAGMHLVLAVAHVDAEGIGARLEQAPQHVELVAGGAGGGEYLDLASTRPKFCLLYTSPSPRDS